MFVPTCFIRSQAMLANLSSTPPFASLLRKDDDNKPGSLPSDSNLKNSPASLHRRVSSHIFPSQRTESETRFSYLFHSLCSSHTTIFLFVFGCHDHSSTICMHRNVICRYDTNVNLQFDWSKSNVDIARNCNKNRNKVVKENSAMCTLAKLLKHLIS